MKRLTNVLMAALALLIIPALPTSAQVVSAVTVASCGTPNNTPVVGNPYPLTQGADGKLCTSGTGGGGGGGTASFTAASGGTIAVIAGSDKPAALDLFSSQSVIPKDNTGTYLPLATSTLQTAGNSSLSTIATNSGTQATAANQTTGNSSLSTIATQTTTTATQTTTTATNTGATTTALTNVTGTKAAGTAAASALLTGGVYNSTPITLTNGQQAALQLGVKGQTVVSLADPTTGALLDPTAASAVQCGTTTGTMVQCALDNTNGTTGSTAPTRAQLMGAQSGANMVSVIQASASAPINVSTATTTQLVALASSQKIYVTSFDVIAGGTGNVTFVYGTGSNCGTGTTSLTGAYNLTAQAGIAKGNGLGPVLVVPASNALCVTTSAAVQMSGSVAYTQF